MTMPILNIQRRMAEQGRIRLGHKITGTTKAGKEYTRPAKLETFRFTSPNADLITQIAGLYGGEAQPWDNNGKPEHEVLTDATSIPVIVVKGGLSQWMETWSGGGCIHRCDGERNVLTDAPCDLQELVKIGRDTVNPHTVAKPTTRLSVMLSEVESLGVWRMETHGWNAAAEIPAMAELAMHVGDLVPATLHLVQRRVVRDGETSRFVVPVLDLHITKARLVELVGGVGGTPALEQAGEPTTTGAAAIEEPRPDYLAEAHDTDDVDECRAIWTRARDAGHMTPELNADINAHVAELQRTQRHVDGGPAEQHGTVVDAEVVEDDTAAADAAPQVDPRTVAWQELLAAGGQRGMGFNEVRDAVEQHTAQPLAECTADQLREVLQVITTGEVVSA